MASSQRGVRVVQIPEGSPAAKAGLLPEDLIVAVDGKKVAGLPAAELHQLLSGEVGSTVRLSIDRRGTPHELQVERAPYKTGSRY